MRKVIMFLCVLLTTLGVTFSAMAQINSDNSETVLKPGAVYSTSIKKAQKEFKEALKIAKEHDSLEEKKEALAIFKEARKTALKKFLIARKDAKEAKRLLDEANWRPLETGNPDYINSAYKFSFEYPASWKEIPIVPPNDRGTSFNKLPFSGNEQLAVNLAIDPSDFEPALESVGYAYTKDTVIAGGVTATRIRYGGLSKHDPNTYEKSIIIIVPLRASDKKVALVGSCVTLSLASECSGAINNVMNSIVIPSFKFLE